MENNTAKWRNAKIKFLKEQKHNLTFWGNSTRNADTIKEGEIREVYFEDWEENNPFKTAHIELYDMVLLKEDEFEVLEISSPVTYHPTELTMIQIQEQAEKLVENIKNAN